MRLLWTLSLLAVTITGCSSAARLPTPTATASPTPLPTSTPTATSTSTPTSTPTPIRTPPALPSVYQTALLNPLDTPHTYIQEPCQYLHDKWSSANSAPGTVAIVVMFHSIVADDITPDANQITEKRFHELIGDLMNHGFEAITTAQLADFLEHNAKIPPHSVLLVVDDRHHAQYFNEYFRPYWEADQWPVVNAYISASRDGYDASVWQEQEVLNTEGWVDYQAHGVLHYGIFPSSSDTYIMGELQGSIDAFKLHFNKVPIAFIWPGGDFTPHAVEIARQLGYRLGFTINPRGPLMFNWIPLSDINDPQRPSWAPEGSANDPLLVLPRYWDTDASIHLDDVVQMGQEAAAYAEQNKATELEYYDIVCAPHYGPIP
jgi:hypothetical protein